MVCPGQTVSAVPILSRSPGCPGAAPHSRLFSPHRAAPGWRPPAHPARPQPTQRPALAAGGGYCHHPLIPLPPSSPMSPPISPQLPAGLHAHRHGPAVQAVRPVTAWEPAGPPRAVSPSPIPLAARGEPMPPRPRGQHSCPAVGPTDPQPARGGPRQGLKPGAWFSLVWVCCLGEPPHPGAPGRVPFPAPCWSIAGSPQAGAPAVLG